MEDNKIGYFEEGVGQKSIMRWIFAVGMVYAMIMTTYVVFTHPLLTAVDMGLVLSGFTAPFVVLKVGQKFAEPNISK